MAYKVCAVSVMLDYFLKWFPEVWFQVGLETGQSLYALFF